MKTLPATSGQKLAAAIEADRIAQETAEKRRQALYKIAKSILTPGTRIKISAGDTCGTVEQSVTTKTFPYIILREDESGSVRECHISFISLIEA